MALSPMMRQYIEIKEQYKDTLLFYRLGDFYEMFYDDAILASKVLELTLTKRDCGLEERAPMCGVPYHAVDAYLAKLIEKGYKIAICEQVSVPNGKGIVKREVVRVLTPGTITESTMLQEDKNNYLASLYFSNNCVGVSWSDISTGEFNHMYIDSQVSLKLNDTLSRIAPAEIICNSEMLGESINLSIVKFGSVCPFTQYNDVAYEYNTAMLALKAQLSPSSVKILEQTPHCVSSAGALITYIKETQKRALTHIKNVTLESSDDYMVLDTNARRALELTVSMQDYKKRGSLLWLMDATSTNMGSRMLKKWIEQPCINVKVINARLDFVEELFNDSIKCNVIHTILESVYDIERLSTRISYGNILPKDCTALANSLDIIPKINEILSTCKSNLANYLNKNIKSFSEVANLIFSAIKPDAINNVRDGGVIKDGYNSMLDEYRNTKADSITIINELEAKEKETTGIKNLRIHFNNVFGYYIEVPNSQTSNVPYNYVRKQTVANAERYITEELKLIESKILHAEDNAVSLEITLYQELIIKLRKYVDDILLTASNISYLDCIASCAKIAKENNFCKPIVTDNGGSIKIVEGRHCVVERILKDSSFVPNDTLLDCDKNKIMLITGPNMAGKSVYMRQVALITIMSQIGSFVPAKSAEISVVDRIFTRVGASDDLSTNRSTFMVEMNEVSYILDNVTDNCLIILDEIGRGTSTYDGLSIAWSIVEFLATHTKAKTLFSTHYHELTDLEGVLSGIKNYKLTLREISNTIVFLRKLMRGSANRSFGIEVAGLAGLPAEIISRAKELLKQLENADIGRQAKMNSQQLSMYNTNQNTEIITILKDINLDNISSRQALDILTDLVEKVRLND